MFPIDIRSTVALYLLGISVLCPAFGAVDPFQPQSSPLATPLTEPSLDLAASAEWVDGAERTLPNPTLLRQILWTRTAAPSTGSFLPYGVGAQPGPRHLRIAFSTSLPVGSVLVRGGGQLSVLRPDAAYPGNLSDESQWIPAQRIVGHQMSTTEVEKGNYAIWILPPGTRTRALRFNHNATPTDQTYAGTLCGVYLLADRFANLAPQAALSTSADSTKATLLVNEQYDDWHGWDNGPTFPHAVTSATPEWITLIWPRAVTLRGLAALWAGFNAADAQIFTGAEDTPVQGAPQSDWHSVGQPLVTHNQYPRALGIDWIDFGKTLQTRAVRLRITQVTDESHHPHLKNSTRDGNRVWLGELMAIAPLQSAEPQTALPPASDTAGPHPPIPVRFRLDAPGYVTLVIDDAKGNRVRNLISDTWFAAGSNTVWWDGTDDLGRNPDAANHGVYLIPTHFVDPGSYTVRGLYHQGIDLHYEFTVYNAGHPGWETADGTGNWLTNHTPPSAALFVPADNLPGGKPLVFLGSYVSEGGAGLQWVDLDGHKQGGRGAIGGNWTGGPYLARDSGPRAIPGVYAYVASVWGDDARNSATNRHVNLRITGLTSLTGQGDKSVLHYAFDASGPPEAGETVRQNWMRQIGGFAVHNGLAVVSLTRLNEILIANAASGNVIGSAAVPSPRGLAFDADGNLLVVTSTRLLSYHLRESTDEVHSTEFTNPAVLIKAGLDDPEGITLDVDGDIYISQHGNSNQVAVYSSVGKFLRAIGHSGPSQAGPYDPLHMNHPRGLTIDRNRHLWVAEDDFQPKRVSVWTLDGKLLQTFYGPSEYGGGGVLDPQDKNLFYYHAMQFKLDWTAGKYSLDSVLYRPSNADFQLPLFASPVNVLYSNGHRYFTNSYLAHGTNGVSIGMLYLDDHGILRPVAALGKANDWSIFDDQAFRSKLPPNSDLTSKAPDKCVLFTWSDSNHNGKVDPEEVTFLKAYTGSITIMSDAKSPGPIMLDAIVDGRATRFAPTQVDAEGTPTYDIRKGQVIVEGAQKSFADGGGQMLYSPQATVLTTAPQPFSSQGLGGVDNQGHRWSYPSLWPGLHPAHSAPVPDHPGELTGTTRLLGSFLSPAGPEVGPIWGINANFGDMYLFTADGLFITQIFQDVRVGKPWDMPQAQRNMLVNDVSPHDENFFPSITQTSDGKVYVVDGGRTSIVRVDGLTTLHRLPSSTLKLTSKDLQAADAYLKQSEATRQQKSGPQVLDVTLGSGPAPSLNNIAQSLSAANWATIDRRITKVGWNDKPDNAEAAITIADGRLLATFRTNDPDLLRNSGAVLNAPFKTGGALDLMIGTNPHADPNREKPVEGDLRLLVYQVNKQTKALLYRAIVPGTIAPVQFSAPDHSISMDQVLDVSNQVELYAEQGSYNISIPVAVLGLKPAPGERIKADIGILRGNGVQTIQRVYWSNKATGITSDVPSEAELTPSLWGDWIFQPAKTK